MDSKTLIYLTPIHDGLVDVPIEKPRISPSMVHLDPGDSQRFSLNIEDWSLLPKWSVNEVVGGNKRVGTIDKKGNYTAPYDPERTEFSIQARFGKQCVHAWATVVIGEQTPMYSFVGCWNKKGERGAEGPGELRQAHGVCLEPSGSLLICDSIRSRVYRYTCEGIFLGEVGLGPGEEPGGFSGPRNIQVSRLGEIFVTDGNSHCIQVFTKKGKFLRGWGQEGSGRHEFRRPHAIALGPNQTIAVADVDNERVVICDIFGRHIRHWGSRGNGFCEFHAPHGLSFDPNGDLFVVEYDGRCQKFTFEGAFLNAFANQSIEGGKSHGDYHYHDMTSDWRGNIYLMSRNTKNNRLHSVDKYNNNGDFITRFKLPPEEERPFGSKGATVSNNGRIFVADTKMRFAGISIFEPE